MSLSRRLVLILLAVSAVGLLALDLVSYAALRSYLSDRVDQQAVDALPLAGVILGGGSRSIKVLCPPATLLALPDVVCVDGLATPIPKG